MSYKLDSTNQHQLQHHARDHTLCAEALMPILQKRIVIISGGRDHRGGAIIVFPSVHDADLKILQDDTSLSRLLLYLSHVPANEVRHHGFTFIIDMRSASWSDHVKPILKCLDDHFTAFAINSVVIVKPENFWQKQKANVGASKYRFDVQIVALDQLCSPHEQDPSHQNSMSSSSTPVTISRSQLLIELGGTMPYCHEIWLRLRVEYEKFTTKAVEIMQAFDHQRRELQHAALPETLHETKIKQQEHGELVKQLERRIRQADEFILRGHRLSTKLSGAWTSADGNGEAETNGSAQGQRSIMSHYSLKSDESSGRGSSIDSIESSHAFIRNADFVHDSTIVAQLITRLQTAKENWSQAVNQRHTRLEQCRLLRIFEGDISKVLQCIDDNRDELLLNSNYTEIGESQRSADTLWDRHKEYKRACEAQLNASVNKYCTLALKWIQDGHFAHQQLRALVGRVNCDWQALHDALRDRELVLQLSTSFHSQAEMFLTKAPDWRRQCGAAVPTSNGAAAENVNDIDSVAQTSCAINSSSSSSSTATATAADQNLSDRTRALELFINQHKELNDEMRQHFDKFQNSTNEIGAALRQKQQQQLSAENMSNTQARNSVISVNTLSSSSSSSLSGNGHHQHQPTAVLGGGGGGGSLTATASYTKAATHVLEIQQRVSSQFKELQQLWNMKRNKLHQQWALQLFREDVKQVIDWLKNHGEAFLQKNNEVGKTLQRAKRLHESHEHFTNVAQNTYYNANKLVSVAEQFVLTGECDRVEIEREKKRLEQHINAFCGRVNRRQELLKASMRFHTSHTQLHAQLQRIEPLLRDEQDEYPNTFDECYKLIHTMESEKDFCMRQLELARDAGMHLQNLLNEERNQLGPRVPSVTIGELAFLQTILQQLNDKQHALQNTWCDQKRRLQIVLEFRHYENDIIDFITNIDNSVLEKYHQKFQNAGLFDSPPPQSANGAQHQPAGIVPQRDLVPLLFANAQDEHIERVGVRQLKEKCKAITDNGKELAKRIRIGLVQQQLQQQQQQSRRIDTKFDNTGNLPSPDAGGNTNGASSGVNNSIEDAIAERIEQLQTMADERLQALQRALSRRVELVPHILSLESLLDDSQRLVGSLTNVEQMLNDCNVVPLNTAELEELKIFIAKIQPFMQGAEHSANVIESQLATFKADNGPTQLNLAVTNSYELCLMHGALNMYERLRRRNDELWLLYQRACEFHANSEAVSQMLDGLEEEYRQHNNEDAKTTLNSVLSSSSASGGENYADILSPVESGDSFSGENSRKSVVPLEPAQQQQQQKAASNSKQMQLKYAVTNVQNKIHRHSGQRNQFKQLCNHVRFTAGVFRKTVRRNINLTFDENSYRYDAVANSNAVQQSSTDAAKVAAIYALNEKLHNSQHRINDVLASMAEHELRVMRALDERLNRLEELQRYLSFEMSARISLDWIDEHGEQCLRRARHQQQANGSPTSENSEASTSAFDVEKLLRDQGETVIKLSELAQRLNDKGRGSYAANIQNCVRQVDLKYKEFVHRLEKYRNNNYVSAEAAQPVSAVAVTITSKQPSAAEILLTEKRSSKANLHRDKVIHELITSEDVYCRDLHACIQTYLKACENEVEKVPQTIRGKHDIIFSNIRELYQFSEQLLAELHRCEKSPDNIGHCFAMWEPRFELYVEYCKNKSRSMELLQCGGPAVKEFFKQIKDQHGLSEDVNSYLIKPVQRIAKYPLFFDQLLKTRDAGSVENEDADDGFQVVKRVLARTDMTMELALLEGQQHNIDQFGDVLLVDSFNVRDFAGGDVAVVDEQQLKRSKKLARLTQRTKADRERTLFLCERVLLVCKKQTREVGGIVSPLYQLKQRIATSSLLSITKLNADDTAEISGSSCLVLAYTLPNSQSTKRLILHSTLVPSAAANILQQQLKTMMTWLEELNRIIFEFGVKRQQEQQPPPQSMMRKKPTNKPKIDNKSSRSSVSSSTLSDSGVASHTTGGATSTSSAFDEDENDDDNLTMNDDVSTNNGHGGDDDNLSQDIADDYNSTMPFNSRVDSSHAAPPPPPLSIKRLTALITKPLRKLGHSMSSVETQYLGASHPPPPPQQIQHNRSSVHEQKLSAAGRNYNNNNNSSSSSKRFSWDSQTTHHSSSSNNVELLSTHNSTHNNNSDDGVSLASSSNDIDLPPAMSKITDPMTTLCNNNNNGSSDSAVLSTATSTANFDNIRRVDTTLTDFTSKLAIVDENQNSLLQQQQ